MSHKTDILSHNDILLKIERMAWQILEFNHGSNEIVMIGIAPKGSRVSDLLEEQLHRISKKKITRAEIHINKDNPNDGNTRIDNPVDLDNKDVVLIDDVLNSGKTLMYATLPILEADHKSLHTVVLANRDHASFPIKADVVGISLATTLQEHITFETDEQGRMRVFLT